MNRITVKTLALAALVCALALPGTAFALQERSENAAAGPRTQSCTRLTSACTSIAPLSAADAACDVACTASSCGFAGNVACTQFSDANENGVCDNRESGACVREDSQGCAQGRQQGACLERGANSAHGSHGGCGCGFNRAI